jgi:hypothetical protein
MKDTVRSEFGLNIEEDLSPEDPIRQKLEEVLELIEENPVRGLSVLFATIDKYRGVVATRAKMMDAAERWFTYHAHQITVQADRRNEPLEVFTVEMLSEALDYCKGQTDDEIKGEKDIADL